jgi:hypothetical protein
VKTTVLILGLPLIFGGFILTAQKPTRPATVGGQTHHSNHLLTGKRLHR